MSIDGYPPFRKEISPDKKPHGTTPETDPYDIDIHINEEPSTPSESPYTCACLMTRVGCATLRQECSNTCYSVCGVC